MATTLSVFSLLLMLSSFFLLPPPCQCHAHSLKSCTFDAIYQLGDSTSDTGNYIRESPMGAASAFTRLPYGETFFKNATGRCSNGQLLIDYLALATGLPFLNPYLNKNANFKNGVNFAVTGATALPTSSLAKKKILSPVTNSSLGVQLKWMHSYFNTICNTDKGCLDCAKKLKSALFMVGEIGGNDYNFAFFQGKITKEVKKIVPDIVQAIKDAVKRVIRYGATRVVVPGNFPIGCFPAYLTRFKTNDSAAYDKFHCLKGLNDFAMYHNVHLQKAIKELKQKNPNAIIAYADYYNAFMQLLRKARSLGFDECSLQQACCGIGGDYNFNLAKMCGAPGVPVCSDPNRRLSWDGIHLTQNAYKFMADWLIDDLFPKLQCTA